MLKIENIEVIKKRPRSSHEPGYEIVFNDGRSIWITKGRTIIALLILIKYGEGSESDLAKGSEKIPEIKKILQGKYPEKLIKDYYSDANKPFSELWNEEGFVWIKNPIGQRRERSQSYVLLREDHEKLFAKVTKAHRKGLSTIEIVNLIQRLPGSCNLCGSRVVVDPQLPPHPFSRDRLKRRIDHRIPVEKGGSSDDTANFQVLCFYCNKSKWQVCNICPLPNCSQTCVLAFPERSHIVAPTGEDISDRIKIL